MNEDRERTGDSPIEPDRKTQAPKSSRDDAPDPGDEIPVPGAMSAAEIDERAQAVEALRRERGLDEGDPPSEP
jgi:hypothetical protein